jgi:hypothetical protein
MGVGYPAVSGEVGYRGAGNVLDACMSGLVWPSELHAAAETLQFLL